MERIIIQNYGVRFLGGRFANSFDRMGSAMNNVNSYKDPVPRINEKIQIPQGLGQAQSPLLSEA